MYLSVDKKICFGYIYDMTDWFTSDTHYFHKNIIRYSNRPFKDIHHMNESLIERFNERVSNSDNVYHLGDFGFANEEEMQRVFDRLNGRKHLILGNHDKRDTKRIRGWEYVRHYDEIRIDGQSIVLFHYAPRVWNKAHHGSIALYGHSHGSMPGNSQSLDVGVDCWDYYPVNFEQIKRRLATLPTFKGYREQAGGSDHHTSKED